MPEAQKNPGKPLFDLYVHLSKRDLAGFYRVHFQHTYRRGMWIIRVAGAALIVLGVVDAFAFGGTSTALEAGCGAGFFALSFWMGQIIGFLASRSFSGPDRVRYRLYERDFEARYEKTADRHAYSEIKQILVSQGALYLYTGRMQAFVLPKESLDHKIGEVSTFLQRASGHKAELVGRAR
jgi:hypothetical protein